MKATRLSLLALTLTALALASCGPSSGPFDPPIGGSIEELALAIHQSTTSLFKGCETLSPEKGDAPLSYDEAFDMSGYGYEEEVVSSVPKHVYDEVYLTSAECFYFTFPDDGRLPLSSFAGRRVECTYSVFNPSGLSGQQLAAAPLYERPFAVVTLYDGEHCLLYSSMAVDYWNEIYQSDYVCSGEVANSSAPVLSGIGVFAGERWSYSYDWLIDFRASPSSLPLKGEGDPASLTLVLASYGRGGGSLLCPEELGFTVEGENAYRLESVEFGPLEATLDVASLR